MNTETNTSNLNQPDSTTADTKPKTSLPYKLGGTDDPNFQHEAEELSRTEATCDWYDERNRDLEYESRVDYESNYIDQNP